MNKIESSEVDRPVCRELVRKARGRASPGMEKVRFTRYKFRNHLCDCYWLIWYYGNSLSNFGPTRPLSVEYSLLFGNGIFTLLMSWGRDGSALRSSCMFCSCTDTSYIYRNEEQECGMHWVELLSQVRKPTVGSGLIWCCSIDRTIL